MRDAFADEITKLGADPKIILLSGDIGNRMFDSFKAKYPKRFYNCGVAEANMIGVAAGLAMSGYRPVVYTITTFLTARCYEQIRVDLCYHRQPVVLVGVGGGLCYASLGATHQACEDIGMLRLLPEMTVVCPGDPLEVRGALREALRQTGPVYLRLGKKGEPCVHKTEPTFRLGHSIIIKPGSGICLLSTGNLLPSALETSALLEKKGLKAQVVSFHTVKPLDEETLTDTFKRFELVVTMEEHSIVGGLGGAVAEWLVDHRLPTHKLLRIGTGDIYCHNPGEQETLREHFKLTPESMTEKVLEAWKASHS